jgi:hypothetical protein
MEHIVQFGISIDDNKIKKTIEDNVMKQVAGAIKNDCMKALVGRKDASNYDYTRKIREMVNDNIQDFFEDNKDKIIEIASDKLAEKLAKTKAVKEAISKSIEELL